jgi:hypothetical protein
MPNISSAHSHAGESLCLAAYKTHLEVWAAQLPPYHEDKSNQLRAVINDCGELIVAYLNTKMGKHKAE